MKPLRAAVPGPAQPRALPAAGSPRRRPWREPRSRRAPLAPLGGLAPPGGRALAKGKPKMIRCLSDTRLPGKNRVHTAEIH